MERDLIVMIVARNIEAAMGRKGLTAPEVARRAGINPTGVYDILSGKSRSPRLDTIHKIAVQGLGVPMSALFAEPTDEELDLELAEELGMMPTDQRRKFLAMARAYNAPGAAT